MVKGLRGDERAQLAFGMIRYQRKILELGRDHVDIAPLPPETLKGPPGVLDHHIGPVLIPSVVGRHKSRQHRPGVNGAGRDMIPPGIDLRIKDKDIVMAVPGQQRRDQALVADRIVDAT